MAGLRVHFVMPAELVERIDAALTDGVSRGEFVRRAVEQALEDPVIPRQQRVASARATPAVPPTSSGADTSAVGGSTPAPAEQPPSPVGGLAPQPPEMSEPERRGFRNLTGAPSSLQAKRDVRPVPKGGKS